MLNFMMGLTKVALQHQIFQIGGRKKTHFICFEIWNKKEVRINIIWMGIEDDLHKAKRQILNKSFGYSQIDKILTNGFISKKYFFWLNLHQVHSIFTIDDSPWICLGHEGHNFKISENQQNFFNTLSPFSSLFPSNHSYLSNWSF